MDLITCLFFTLLAITLIFQIGAIVIRKLFLSLFFSLIYSLSVSVILLAIGHYALALMNFALSAGLNHLSLIATSLLIGSHNNSKPQRRLSLSLFFFPGIAIAIGYIILLFIWPNDESILVTNLSPKTLDPLYFEKYTLTFLIVALMALSSLMGTLLLLRRDDVTDAP
jgi:hypothetical protein